MLQRSKIFLAFDGELPHAYALTFHVDNPRYRFPAVKEVRMDNPSKPPILPFRHPRQAVFRGGRLELMRDGDYVIDFGSLEAG